METIRQMKLDLQKYSSHSRYSLQQFPWEQMQNRIQISFFPRVFYTANTSSSPCRLIHIQPQNRSPLRSTVHKLQRFVVNSNTTTTTISTIRAIAAVITGILCCPIACRTPLEIFDIPLSRIEKEPRISRLAASPVEFP